MKSIIEDIRNNEYKSVYLLYGEEAYLRKQYKNKLKEALSVSGDTMNYCYYEGKDINMRAVIDMAETMPFMAPQRLIIIENSGLFKAADENMVAYMHEIPETTYFVFVESEVDKRSKMFKAVKNVGRAVEMPRQDEAVLKRWILSILKKENKSIKETTLNLFISRAGDDMEIIKNELEKLICYTLEKEVIAETDVEAVCAVTIVGKIFSMVDAIAEKRQSAALLLYNDLLALKEPPMRIMFMIARQFNLLMQVKELRGAGYDSAIIAEKTGLHKFVVSKHIAQSGKFKNEMLREAVRGCVDAEEAVKTGKISDTMSVELLIVKYSSQ